MKLYLIITVLGLMMIVSACSIIKKPVPSYPDVDREDRIPDDIIKRGPEVDRLWRANKGPRKTK